MVPVCPYHLHHVIIIEYNVCVKDSIKVIVMVGTHVLFVPSVVFFINNDFIP